VAFKSSCARIHPHQYDALDSVQMLFMVIERFHSGKLSLVAERFRNQGRMLPDGVVYHASWVDASGQRCFQIMEAPSGKLLEVWISRWSDLVDFETIPVLTSAEFWAQQ
jgi:Protein of unknown function (DUF3303)